MSQYARLDLDVDMMPEYMLAIRRDTTVERATPSACGGLFERDSKTKD